MSLNVRKMWASAAHDMNMRTPQCMRHGQLVRVKKPVWGRATRARNIDCVPGSKIDAKLGLDVDGRVALGHGVRAHGSSGPRPSPRAKRNGSQEPSQEQVGPPSMLALLANQLLEALPSRLVPETSRCIGNFSGPVMCCKERADRLGHATPARHALVELLLLFLPALRGALADPSACGAAWQSALAHVLGEHLADDAGVQAHEVVVEGLADTLVRLVDWT